MIYDKKSIALSGIHNILKLFSGPEIMFTFILFSYFMDEIFKQQVWEITKLVPKGRVTSYGAIAKAVGYPNHSRHVGKAMGGCPKDVPAHRVISSSGTLSVPEFQVRLEAEGIEVENFRIKNFKKLFWNPLDEL
ncbi:MGMT family protein [Chryseobacterium geocarposphaerae]|uniref:Methylated-DNA-protein-cysteine methyltransferase-like protein n=2 Tax=Chryseobacterium TaxID=59732 RepID=A0A2M9CB39_9FLAO|nr:MGMT family protein [Chryseobacterium geocarposphaerae]PJJ68045.1 methylated-DNA-protein-cysteine methyltransferase-like protein [Chryseobacterium geocarposphaerae]